MMICNCTMAGTKSCLYCNNRKFSIDEYNFLWTPEPNFLRIPEYDFPRPERIIIEFPKVRTYTTTSTIPYENR